MSKDVKLVGIDPGHLVVWFEVPCSPVPLQRPKFSVRGKFAHVYDSPKNKEAKLFVRFFALEAQGSHPPLLGALTAELEFHMPKPKSKIRKHSTPYPYADSKPDIDNLIKLVFDAIGGVVFKDDSQIIEVTAKKIWAKGDPKTVVKISEVL